MRGYVLPAAKWAQVLFSVHTQDACAVFLRYFSDENQDPSLSCTPPITMPYRYPRVLCHTQIKSKTRKHPHRKCKVVGNGHCARWACRLDGPEVSVGGWCARAPCVFLAAAEGTARGSGRVRGSQFHLPIPLVYSPWGQGSNCRAADGRERGVLLHARLRASRGAE